MNKKQFKGRIKELIGTIREDTGRILGNKSIEEQGRAQIVAGKAQAFYGDVTKTSI
jgi:uncharacterized protein YjbJ (UPF0337 family)